MLRRFYIYKHVCPITKKLLYIGKGSGTRAWEFNGDRTKLNHSFGTRYKDHSDYLRKLIRKGYLQSDWVKIIHRRLTNEEAHAKEAVLIQEHRPVFNKLKGGGRAKFTKTQIRKIQLLHKLGKSTYKLAAIFGCANSTIYGIVTNKTKYYRDFYK